MNPLGSWKDTTKAKGVRREVESEESGGQSLARRTEITYKVLGEGKAPREMAALLFSCVHLETVEELENESEKPEEAGNAECQAYRNRNSSGGY